MRRGNKSIDTGQQETVPGGLQIKLNKEEKTGEAWTAGTRECPISLGSSDLQMRQPSVSTIVESPLKTSTARESTSLFSVSMELMSGVRAEKKFLNCKENFGGGEDTITSFLESNFNPFAQPR